MRALILISLSCSSLGAFAHKPTKRPLIVTVPNCEQHLLNVASYLHDPLNNRPYDDVGINGQIAVGAPVRWEAFERAGSMGKFVMGADHRGAYIVQPAQRAMMIVDGFRDRIPRRDLRYVRQLKANGFTTTHDEAFERVLTGCVRAVRRDRENGIDRISETWLSPDIRTEFLKMHLHPDRLAHSVEVWLGPQLVGGLIITFVNGVPMGETMFFDRTYGSNIGKLALYALLERLEAGGHPRLDVQTILNPQISLSSRWGAILEPRNEHERHLAEHQNLNLEY